MGVRMRLLRLLDTLEELVLDVMHCPSYFLFYCIA